MLFLGCYVFFLNYLVISAEFLNTFKVMTISCLKRFVELVLSFCVVIWWVLFFILGGVIVTAFLDVIVFVRFWFFVYWLCVLCCDFMFGYCL